MRTSRCSARRSWPPRPGRPAAMPNALATAAYTFPVPDGLALDVAVAVFQAGAVAATADGAGRIGLYGFASGQWPTLDAQAIATRGLTVSGPLGMLIRKPDAGQRNDAEQALAAAARGELTPRIHARFPLERAADAHRELEGRRSVGAIVLTG